MSGLPDVAGESIALVDLRERWEWREARIGKLKGGDADGS
jgi:hypothetical protein